MSYVKRHGNEVKLPGPMVWVETYMPTVPSFDLHAVPDRTLACIHHEPVAGIPSPSHALAMPDYDISQIYFMGPTCWVSISGTTSVQLRRYLTIATTTYGMCRQEAEITHILDQRFVLIRPLFRSIGLPSYFSRFSNTEYARKGSKKCTRNIGGV